MALAMLCAAGHNHSANAQTVVKLVGNIHEPRLSDFYRMGSNARVAFAQGFTTGEERGGYIIDQARVRLGDTIDKAFIELEASIRLQESNGQPSDDHTITLVRTKEINPNDHNSFDAPEGFNWLAPNTKYFLVFECLNNTCNPDNDNMVEFRITNTGGEDSNGQDDWSLRDTFYADYGNPNWRLYSEELVVQIRGYNANQPYIVDDGIEVVSVPTALPSQDTYVQGDAIEFEVTFSAAVFIKSGTDPTFTFRIRGNSGNFREAEYTGGSGTRKLQFAYTVADGDGRANNGIQILADDKTWVTEPEGIVDGQDRPVVLAHEGLGKLSEHKVRADVTRASIEDIEIISEPLFDVVGYGRDEDVKVKVTTDSDVMVSGITPRLALQIGSETREALYERNESAPRSLVFTYTVVEADRDSNGISVPENALAVDGDPYQGQLGSESLDSDGVSLRLLSAALGHDPDHKVDGSKNLRGNASLSSLSVTDTDLSPSFSISHYEYEADVTTDVELVTVEATPRVADALVAIVPEDADGAVEGHQVALQYGANEVLVQVQSLDEVNTLQYTVEIQRASAPPAAPDAPEVTSGSAGVLTIRWTEPTTYGEPVTGYDVQYQEDGAPSWTTVPHTGTGTEATVTVADPNAVYHAQVRAKSALGESPWSDPGTLEARAPDAPDRPTVIAGTDTDPNQDELDVAWNAPNNNGAPIDKYWLQYRERDESNWVQVTDSVAGTSTSTTLALPPTTTIYYVQVRAENTVGPGPWSPSGSREIATPFRPEAPTMTVLSPTSFKATWEAPEDNGAPITDYDVRYKAVSESGWTDAQHVGSGTETVITGLTKGTSYEVQVSATNSAGTSSWSISGERRIQVPDAPRAPTLTANSSASMKVQWSAPASHGAPITGYAVRYRQAGAGSWTDWPHEGTSRTTTIPGLTAGYSYEAQISAISAAGEGPWSSEGSARIATPDRPALPSVSPSGPTGLNVRWTAPADNGSPITGYAVRYREAGTTPWTDWAHEGTTTSTRITDLVEDTRYSIEVRAVNRVGPSPWSPARDGTPMTSDAEHGDVRLVDDNGVTINGQGRLEVFYRGEWGTVCDDRFDRPFRDHSSTDTEKVPNIAANLACQLATGDEDATGATVSRTSLGISLAHEDIEIWLDDVRCAAGSTHWTEHAPTGLHHCYHAGIGLENCEHDEDVHLQCTASDTATQEGAEALTARFENAPAAHDGASPFTIEVVFNETPHGTGGQLPGMTDDTLAEILSVTNGTVTSVSRVNGDGAHRRATIEPDGAQNVTIGLVPSPNCTDELALCTETGGGLATPIVLQVLGPGAVVAFSAAFENVPEAHDGTTPFTVEIVFSEPPHGRNQDLPGLTNGGLKRALEVTGGRATTVRRVNGSHVRRVATVAPHGTDAVTVALAPRADCADEGAVCTEDGRPLSTAIVARIADPTTATQVGTEPLTARFADVPVEHDGKGAFGLRLAFSEAVFDGTEAFDKNKAVRDALAVSGGVVTNARRVDPGAFDAWWIKVKPSGNEAVSLSLGPAPDCAAAGALCTPDGRALSNLVAARVQGPAGLAVADARVEEGEGAVLAFEVTLDRARQQETTVDYATGDGSAEAGLDYEAASGTLRFAPGETAKTVSVTVLDDAHDEGEETMTLTLSNPSGAYLADAEATGTIENTDHMPQAWLARFGRTVAEQVIEAVEERMRAAPRPGAEVTLAGQRLGGGTPESQALDEAEEKARLDDLSAWLRDEACRDAPGAGADCPAGTLGVSREVTGRDLLTGSAFALTGGSAEGGFATLWGRGAFTRFDGREGELTLDGEVASLLLGADWTHERWTAGLMVSHADGDGSYQGADSGEVASTLTGLYPWGRYAMNDRVTVWGAAGYGSGKLTLTPEDHEPFETDMDLAMAAAGLRGVVVEAPAGGGPELAVKTDAMAVRTSSDAIRGDAGDGGNLAAATGDVTRLRLGLEGTWRGLVLGTGTLAPRLEVGVRHDGGDAETGFGLDLGAGLAWSDPETGFAAEASGRGLLTHESAGFGQRGFAGRLGWDPRPGTDRGPSLTLTQSVGVSARGGAEALLGRTTLEGLAANDDGEELANRRFEMKLGYGFAVFGDRYTSTPEIGLGWSESERETVLGWRLAEERRSGIVFGLDVEGARREPADGDGEAAHRLGLGLGWRLEGAADTAFEVRFEGARIEAANDDGPEHRLGLRMTARW